MNECVCDVHLHSQDNKIHFKYINIVLHLQHASLYLHVFSAVTSHVLVVTAAATAIYNQAFMYILIQSLSLPLLCCNINWWSARFVSESWPRVSLYIHNNGSWWEDTHSFPHCDDNGCVKPWWFCFIWGGGSGGRGVTSFVLSVCWYQGFSVVSWCMLVRVWVSPCCSSMEQLPHPAINGGSSRRDDGQTAENTCN